MLASSIKSLLLVSLLVAFFAYANASINGFNARAAMDGVPKKVIYIDWVDAPADQGVRAAIDAGYNVVNLAFWMQSGPTDYSTTWSYLDDNTKADVLNYAHSQGAVVLISAAGSVEYPYDKIDGWSYGTQAAQWAVSQSLDGVDFDFENFGQPFTTSNMNATQTISWVADATNAARQVLGDTGIVTHAPQAPYFGPIGPSNTWTGDCGGYSAVYSQSADATDWYNIQFYNQGGTCYSTYVGLFFSSQSDCDYLPGNSVQEISTYGIPLNKIVVGKYVLPDDASDGWVDPGTLGQWFNDVQSNMSWSTGVMGWELHDDSGTNYNWIHQIYP